MTKTFSLAAGDEVFLNGKAILRVIEVHCSNDPSRDWVLVEIRRSRNTRMVNKENA